MARTVLAALLLMSWTGCAVQGLRTAHTAADGLPRANAPREIEIISVSGARFRPPVKSWQALHQEHVVMQRYDYSCGAAALTTMFVYYFQDAVTEQRVLDTIFTRLKNTPGDRNQVEDRVKNGLSMLDLQQAAADLGYQSAVAKITLEQTHKLEAPVVVRIIKNDFKHFVVLRGIVDEHAFLADPIRGNIRISEAEFLRQWNYVALFLGKEGFGLPKNHPLALHVKLPVALEREHAHRALFPWPEGPR